MAEISFEIRIASELAQENALYRALLARRSVRRYRERRLNETELAQVHQIIERIEPLVPENTLHVLARDDMLRDESLVAGMGAYGRLVTPPHALVPYLLGEHHPLVDLGYRVEQIVVHMTVLHIATCYIGTLRREANNRGLLGLPAHSRCAALLVFGFPATAAHDFAIDSLIRAIGRCDTRMPVHRIFFEDSFDNPASPPAVLSPLITAARLAPSAVNAQPWRFLWRQGEFSLFVRRHNPKYGRSAGQAYRFYDAGICMANIKLAMQALKMRGDWILFDQDGQDIPMHPAELQPIARLRWG
jgi:hypothetical protein